jgi:MYXO-CTERM domain-containing protein
MNGSCQGQAEGEASASCAFAPNGGGSAAGFVAMLGALGLAGFARRRRG